MPRPLQPCGTHAAYKRHKRRGERPCDACARAAREFSRRQRERARGGVPSSAVVAPIVAAQARRHEGDAVELVEAVVSYGKSAQVEVPTTEDPAASARWALRRVRAAMLTARPADVAALARAESEIVERLNAATASEAPAPVSALDQIAARRAARMAQTPGV